MTTPKSKSPNKARSKKPEPARTNAIRSGVRAQAANAKRADSEERDHSKDPAIDEAVADAVRSSYDTLAKTIAQGREAAEKFRQGQYNMRQVPHDVETMILRLLDLARQLSGTTIDIVEQLLHQMTAVATLPEPGATKVPSFREHGKGKHKGHGDEASGLLLTVRIKGAKEGAKDQHAMLQRPKKPTRPEQLSVTPLTTRDGKAKLPGKVEFSFDVSIMGLVATVPVPSGQPAGTYVGQIYAGDQDEPLGLMVLKVG
ncbi:hypothetical protein [Qipengyuania soli]|uniref:Uncharacterized protein n=1 Tax=Qipengyuania soli TaxID=2782568 RepID=A0A7S8ISS6_9SPHN|nr:hypothetical protein [Qipengyuania soli]QPC99123.1 hypothetical protein IRL76_00610 [Qipengyuania soli]